MNDLTRPSVVTRWKIDPASHISSVTEDISSIAEDISFIAEEGMEAEQHNILVLAREALFFIPRLSSS